MLGQCRKQLTNIDPALVECLVLTEIYLYEYKCMLL